MVVDIKMKNAPSYRVASMIRVGSWTPNVLRAEFGQLVRWAKKNRLAAGKWFMYFHDEPGGKRPANRLRFEACLQIKGKAAGEGKIRIKNLPKQKVLSVTFNPDKISAGLVYSGIYGSLRYRGLKEAGAPREVYIGNPWTNPRAWANVEVQVPVKKK